MKENDIFIFSMKCEIFTLLLDAISQGDHYSIQKVILFFREKDFISSFEMKIKKMDATKENWRRDAKKV